MPRLRLRMRLILTIAAVPPVGNWILALGAWNDSGVWDDSDVWRDV
jgi:hypothetical protein